ncbi:MAG: class I SAM-dependent methyltransferase [Phycisphaerales bacterium]
MSISSKVPWWAKIAAKCTLARVPVPYAAWRRMGIFVHGKMLDAQYSRHVFEQHLAQARAHGVQPRSVLELGPGDSVATAIWARAAGAERTTLVDAGRFATDGPPAYRAALAAAEMDAAIADAPTLDAMLERLHARYLCEGLASLRALPDASVDFAFSNAVLEHVFRDEFEETCRQLLRIQAPGSIGSHRVDLRDHLGGKLESLRFSPELWEKPWFARSGFYTNRLRASQVRAAFQKAGFEILSCEERRWERLPTPRSTMHPSFSKLEEADLLVSGILLVVRRPGSA